MPDNPLAIGQHAQAPSLRYMWRETQLIPSNLAESKSTISQGHNLTHCTGYTKDTRGGLVLLALNLIPRIDLHSLNSFGRVQCRSYQGQVSSCALSAHSWYEH